jgi:hypothetical protein
VAIDLQTATTSCTRTHRLRAGPAPSLAMERPVFFNHTLFNPDGTLSRLLRYFNLDGARLSVLTVARTAARSVHRSMGPATWLDWRSPRRVLLTVADPSGAGRQYVLIGTCPGGWATHDVLGPEC